ncbi:hypothetical protein GGR55DRAFT_677896 [Xylaria sp. FL0064]|nr:hypothetical protein GGR55DRAFT_677896 [Xylaria sp. FL0064]
MSTRTMLAVTHQHKMFKVAVYQPSTPEKHPTGRMKFKYIVLPCSAACACIDERSESHRGHYGDQFRGMRSSGRRAGTVNTRAAEVDDSDDAQIYTIDTKAAEVEDSDDSQIYTIDTKAAEVDDSDDTQIYTIDTKAAEVNDADDSQIYTIDTKAAEVEDSDDTQIYTIDTKASEADA